MRRFHSSPLWSIRRNVRNAQFTFAAEPPKRRTATWSLVMWSRRMPTMDVLDNSRQPFAYYFLVLLARPADSTQLLNRVESSCRLGAFRSSRPVPSIACENRKAAILPALFLLVSLVDPRYRLPRTLKSYQ